MKNSSSLIQLLIFYLANSPLMHVFIFFIVAMHFSRLLKGWIPDLVKSDQNLPLDEQGLIQELKRAVITSNGKLTPSFEYITIQREKNELQMNTMMKKKEVNKVEVGATQSILHDNVTIISKDKIKPEKLVFDDDDN